MIPNIIDMTKAVRFQVVATHAFSQSTREKIQEMFDWTNQDLMQLNLDGKDVIDQDDTKEKKTIDPKLLDKAWHMLYDDCLIALGICVEGELKHFHKARYMLAKGLYRKGEAGDLERAKEELSFCFKSSRSSFTMNMWEIDGMARKGRYLFLLLICLLVFVFGFIYAIDDACLCKCFLA